MRTARATKLAKDTVSRIRAGEAMALGNNIVTMPLGGTGITVIDGNNVAAAGLSKDEATQRLIENLTAK